MKNKLGFVALVTLLFVCCPVYASSIDYELEIDSDRMFHETITYVIEDSTNNKHLLNVLNDNVYFDKDSTMPYRKNVVNNGSNVVVTLKYDYPSTMLENNSMLNKCFKSFHYDEDDYKMTYYAESPFKCSDYADNIKITVISDIESIINTADVVSGNTYIWNSIDKDFMMDLSLGEYSSDSDVLSPVADDEVVSSDDMDEWPDGNLDLFPYGPVIVSVSSIIVIALVIFIIIKKKKSNKNDEEPFIEE